MNVEQRLEMATRAVETQIDGVPQRPLPVVEQRNRRHKVLVGATGATLAILMLVGSAFLMEGAVDETAAATPAASSDAALDVSSVEWAMVDSELGYVRDTASSNGQLYALSTTPGVAVADVRQPDAIYSSADGETWTRHDVDPGLWVGAIDAHDGVLYAVSTTPGTAVVGDVAAQVAASTDNGETWQTSVLPVVAAPPNGMGEEYRSIGTDVAAGPAGVIAVVNTQFSMDYAPFVPAEYSGDTTYVYRTADGFEVVDWELMEEARKGCGDSGARGAPASTLAPSASTTSTTSAQCASETLEKSGVVYEATWDELGVTPPTTEFSELFMSRDGSDFESVASPFGPGATVELTATGDGFVGVEVLSTETATELRLWSSTDGREWVRLATPPAAIWIDTIGEVNGDLVAVGVTVEQGIEAAGVFISSDGGSTWETVDLATIAGVAGGGYTALAAADIGPDGVTVGFWATTTSAVETGSFHVVATADLQTWLEVQLPEPQAEMQPYPGWVLSGDGETLVSVTSLVDGSTQHQLLVGTP